MNPILRNILAVIVGALIGMIVNFSLISLNGPVVPLPEGADISTMEGLEASMKLFEPIHFLMPYLGHAVGTLVGAFLVAKIAATHNMKFALLIGVFFLIGGIKMVMDLPSPMWFNVLDLVTAYIPMGWLGGTLAMRK